MTSIDQDEARRTAPLALWRYAHDYLRAAKSLCQQNHISCVDSQVPYHLAAQGVEFALKAYLGAKGSTMATLRVEIGRSLSKALAQSEAKGMPPLPARWRVAIETMSACHRDTQFVYLATPENGFPDIDPLVDAGVWILDWIAPHVVEHYVVHLAGDDPPPMEEFVRRLRADLSATSDVVRLQPAWDPDMPVEWREPMEVRKSREPGSNG